MPPDHRIHPNKETPIVYDYEADPQWRKKPLTPANILLNDVRLETLRPDRGPMLEINERPASSVVPSSASHSSSTSFARISDTTSIPIEKQSFWNLEEDFGWMRHLRLQHDEFDSGDAAKCRWIHCSSKFPEYLRGMLWAMSDDLATIANSMRLLDTAIQRNTRFSKHGKYFVPFSQTLNPQTEDGEEDVYPMLMSVPFLDWTVQGSTPPLRFQVDRREGFSSSRSSAHIIRSILQHFYRLEDTSDRERAQVFAKHKPWNSNRELDLKVRQWYGHYPSGLNVDELWILVVDSQHIVTLSSNQTWKSRWPPLQLSSRISDVAFRGIRNNYFRSEHEEEYTAITHAIASLSGAVGMMHRNFWPDIVLCLADRYAGHLGHLQYRLHRSPSTKLVMDLIACQEELNIVIQITEQQVGMIHQLQDTLSSASLEGIQSITPSLASRKRRMSIGHDDIDEYHSTTYATVPRRSTYRQLSTSLLSDPLAQLLDNLERELADLRDLRDNTDRLINRTIQLVNIRLEDHGKAILVFTVVTIIFLPLNFVSSFFGMNFADIRGMDTTQRLFWPVALCLTAGVVGASLLLAFSGGAVLEQIHLWKDNKRRGDQVYPIRTTTMLHPKAASRLMEHNRSLR